MPVLALGLLLGTYLRLHGLREQIPIDDEWHGLDFALSRDLWFLLTHFSRAGANSVAYNLYLRAALDAVGWTEVSLALPSLLAGILLLWLFPRWVWQRFGAVAGIVSSVLLACSPFLIFYSRVARAYAVVLLLECLALVALCEWLRTARRGHAVAFVMCGGLAIWGHATALPPLVAALVAVSGYRWAAARHASDPLLPSVRQLAVAGLGMLGLAAVLWFPALRTPMPEVWHPAGRFSARTFQGTLELLSGTGGVVFPIIFAVVALIGTVLAARTARQEIVVLVAAVLGGSLAVLVTRPNASGIAGVFVRYLLPAFLLASLAVGVAAASAWRAAATRARRGLVFGGILVLLAALIAVGPLPRLLGTTNSFTKHPTFAYDYTRHDPERARPDPLAPAEGPGIHRLELQPFYAELAREPGDAPVIEYPFLLGEDANLLYFAQQVHGRPVLAGYYRSGALDRDVFGIAVGERSPSERRPPSPGYIMNGMMVDHVFGRSESDGRIRLRTVVDIADPDAVARSRAQYLILHWNLLREFFHIGPAWGSSEFVARIRERLSARYGSPRFENDAIVVFRLSDVVITQRP